MDIKIEEPYLALARELHRAYPVADAHLDLAAEILFRHQAGEHNVIRNHYLPDFRSAGIKLVVSSVFVEDYDTDHRKRRYRPYFRERPDWYPSLYGGT